MCRTCQVAEHFERSEHSFVVRVRYLLETPCLIVQPHPHLPAVMGL